MNSKALVNGLLAGLAGIAAMTLAEKLEQFITKRPNSYVPAHTLEKLLYLTPNKDNDLTNWAMHWGHEIILGTVRGIMASNGLRDPAGSFLFMNLRLLNDQTLENTTDVDALPWTWPKDEQTIDLIHKGIYAFVTGAVADALIHSPHSAPDVRKGWTLGKKLNIMPLIRKIGIGAAVNKSVSTALFSKILQQ